MSIPRVTGKMLKQLEAMEGFVGSWARWPEDFRSWKKGEDHSDTMRRSVYDWANSDMLNPAVIFLGLNPYSHLNHDEGGSSISRVRAAAKDLGSCVETLILETRIVRPLRKLPEGAAGEVDETQAHWKEMGFKFQFAAERLLTRMGYKVLKAQHDPDIRKSASSFRGSVSPVALGEYLWSYADYITARKGQIFIVDVKTKPYSRLKVGGRWCPLGADGSWSFTEKEVETYRASPRPVQILLITYNDSGDLRRLGPASYQLIPFDRFQFSEFYAGGVLPNMKSGFKKLTSRDVFSLLRETKAFDVAEIGSGFVGRKQRNNSRAHGHESVRGRTSRN